MTQLQQVLDLGYEVKLPVFEGPLDLLLYLVEKNELDPKDIQIAVITDQYLEHLKTLEKTDLGEAGEFLVMAARLMRLKARELLPAEDKDPLEEMEYMLDRQALIAQMLEYRKFKEAARVLRENEDRNFGALPRGRSERPPAAAPPGAMAPVPEPEDGEAEAGIYDLLAAFRAVMTQRPRIPVHEVEIDEVTIEDRMQHVEAELAAAGRMLFEDLFGNDPRRMAKVVTFMALLELCKLDRVMIRQNRLFGTIWVYRKDPAQTADPDRAQELAVPEPEVPDTPPEGIRPGLVDWVQDQIRQRTARTALDQILADLERELREEGGPAPDAAALASLAQASADPGAPDDEPEADPQNEPDPEPV